MSEVIHVNFRNRSRTMVNGDTLYWGFLDILQARGLSEEDVLDVLDGIKDFGHYQQLDADLQMFVDAWHKGTADL